MFHLQVLTPEEVVFDGEAVSVVAPGKDGYLGVLSHHSPLITLLKPGTLIITTKSEKSYYSVSSGFLETSDNETAILVKTAAPSDPVDIGTGGAL